MLNPYTDFEQVTAKQLCLERNRDTPNDKDLADAVRMARAWNQQRIKLGLWPWS